MTRDGKKEQWAVLCKCRVKPGSYETYDTTVFSHAPIDGEPDQPEYRVDEPCQPEYCVPGDASSVMRVEHHRSVVVESAIFVRLNFLEGTIPGNNLKFDTVAAIMDSASSSKDEKK